MCVWQVQSNLSAHSIIHKRASSTIKSVFAIVLMSSQPACFLNAMESQDGVEIPHAIPPQKPLLKQGYFLSSVFLKLNKLRE